MLDCFINKINHNKFSATNKFWNLYCFNSPENVGMLSDLINQKAFSSKEEWEEYYYEHGRSKEQIKKIGEEFYLKINEFLSQNDEFIGDMEYMSQLTLEECIECVRFRVICETWNGIVVRETNTINQLIQRYGDKFTFNKTEGNIDYNYAVDFFMYYNGTLICGIQIKPESYTEFNTNTKEAWKANKVKNEKFTEIYNVPVVTIRSSTNGFIAHNELTELNKLNSKYL